MHGAKNYQIVRDAVELRHKARSEGIENVLDIILQKGVPEQQVDAELVIALYVEAFMTYNVGS